MLAEIRWGPVVILMRTGEERKTRGKLAERVGFLEDDVHRLEEELKNLTTEFEEHEHEEEFPAYEELDRRLLSMDAFKADRHHTHKEEDGCQSGDSGPIPSTP